MTYRERKEARAAKRLEWAAGRDAKARAGFEKARRIADGIPLGQPILVGHHSEKRHRADIARIDSGMRQGVESQDMAAKHRSTAAEIERQLDRSIYDDDPDAVEQIEARIEALTAKRAQMTLVNKLYRKADVAGLAALGLDYEQLKTKLAAAGGYWGKQPHLAYEMSNLGGRISKDRERVKFLKLRQARTAAAEASPSGVTASYHKGYTCASGAYEESDTFYVRLTFAEKPERDTLTALKAAGFHWGAGSWTGETSKLPQAIKELLA